MYQSTHTGAQADEAVDKALSADSVPTPGSTNLVQSGGVKTYTDDKVIRIPASGTLSVSAASSATVIAYSDDPRITDSHYLIHWEIGAPQAQTSIWTVATTANPTGDGHRLTVSGTCSAPTSIVLYLERND